MKIDGATGIVPVGWGQGVGLVWTHNIHHTYIRTCIREVALAQ